MSEALTFTLIPFGIAFIIVMVVHAISKSKEYVGNSVKQVQPIIFNIEENQYTVKIDASDEAYELYSLCPDLKVSYFCNGEDLGEVTLKGIHSLDFDFFNEETQYILITEKHFNIINEYKKKQALLKEYFIKQMKE